MSARNLILALLPLGLLTTAPAQAYIGPGAGAGTIAVVLGILASVVMAFFAVLWYPVKRVFKKRRSARAAAVAQTDAQSRDNGVGGGSKAS
ncbi:MAG: hypothetical protein LJE69_12770 [Thiohalocapsa sp.]|jgi:uncharacterized membrane protein YdjX (TVP38/TMEM64 family)|uniref:hypothetical protein n=1 Tax=Thiohalocapsa sp. TaxID=2497641 RepID=UPI0025FB08A0|nr:hypothetical protein [Thiohalocapsa sp.]MCG6942109.1 hypothetical protein [Thiohalocapsa sp.]